MPGNTYNFNISLSVLNHLGRNLYRSFATVLGEAISNSWDADSENVWIYINKENNTILIRDDGIGMTSDDFQNKLLKIGYSKRRSGASTPIKSRPFIGRKGIGKLALLSCAEKITIISKIEGGEYTGGVIDNTGLEQAITDDLQPQDYPLGQCDLSLFNDFTNGHGHGTIIYFENLKDGMKNSLDFLKKIIALYFRFSLIDENFSIFIDDEKVTLDSLKDLAEATQFVWKINEPNDPYINEHLKNLIEPIQATIMPNGVSGFIASVVKPRDLKVTSTEERVGVDLFVNGRLRERDILKHIPTARVAENYFYGQIHYNDLDDDKDRFATSREGIIADDEKYKLFLDALRKKILEIITDWDKFRIAHRHDGDPENETRSEKQKASISLFNAVSREYDLPEGSVNKKKVGEWVDSLGDDAVFNFESYSECFISENLIRRLIDDKAIVASTEAQRDIDSWKIKENQNKTNGGICIDIRRDSNDFSYLSMDGLANLVDKPSPPSPPGILPQDAKQYRPIRDALMHTALLTDAAKVKLTTIYTNIKARIITLLS